MEPVHKNVFPKKSRTKTEISCVSKTETTLITVRTSDFRYLYSIYMFYTPRTRHPFSNTFRTRNTRNQINIFVEQGHVSAS
jgi:hypothetical protein